MKNYRGYKNVFKVVANVDRVSDSVTRHYRLDTLEQTSFSLMLVGLDGFQAVIDSEGPRGGDERVLSVMNAIQAAIEEILRISDDTLKLAQQKCGNSILCA